MRPNAMNTGKNFSPEVAQPFFWLCGGKARQWCYRTNDQALPYRYFIIFLRLDAGECSAAAHVEQELVISLLFGFLFLS